MIRAAAFVVACTRSDVSLASKDEPGRSKRVVRSTVALAVPPNPGKRKQPSLQTCSSENQSLHRSLFCFFFLVLLSRFFPLSRSLSLLERMPDLPGDSERSLRSVDSEALVSLGTFPKNCSPGRVPLPPKRNRGGAKRERGYEMKGTCSIAAANEQRREHISASRYRQRPSENKRTRWKSVGSPDSPSRST